MKEPESRTHESPIQRGRQIAPPHMHWRVDGQADRPDAPLVLALHGWGMNEDFFALLLQKVFARPVRVLIPRAPIPAPSTPGNTRGGGSWYNYDGNQDSFRLELARVESELAQLLRETEEANDWRPSCRFLVGFSQGGYCGAWTAIRRSDLFDGMAIVGARLKAEFLEREMAVAADGGFRALLLHGERDRSVSPEAAERGRAALEAAGIDVRVLTFDAGHTLGRAQARAIGEWLDEVTK